MSQSLIEVLNYGGGTQTIAIVVLILEGKLPKPDFVVIADTGRERSTTWNYMQTIVRPALETIGLEIQRISREEFAAPRGRELFATSGHLMIPAFTNQSGEISKLSAFCSGAWKKEVVDRWFAITQKITRKDRRHWIGYSLEESKRWGNMMNSLEYNAGLIRLPLVRDIPTRRHEAIRIVEKYGWPTPPRSRCFDCPNQSDAEWVEVKTGSPEEFSEAIKRDGTMRLRDPNAFLHQSCKPLSEVDLSQPDDLFSAGCPSGECFL